MQHLFKISIRITLKSLNLFLFETLEIPGNVSSCTIPDWWKFDSNLKSYFFENNIGWRCFANNHKLAKKWTSEIIQQMSVGPHIARSVYTTTFAHGRESICTIHFKKSKTNCFKNSSVVTLIGPKLLTGELQIFSRLWLQTGCCSSG